MRILKDLYLNLLGVGELLENAQAVLDDWLGRKRPAPAGLQGKVRRPSSDCSHCCPALLLHLTPPPMPLLTARRPS